MPRLYVGRLSQRCTERDLSRFFDGYGKIREVMMKNGYAFLDFEDIRDAEDAAHDLNGKELLGDRVIIEHAKGVERGTGGYPNRGVGERSDRERSDRGERSDRDGGYGGSFSTPIGNRKQRARDKYGPPIRTKWEIRIENLSSRVSWQDLKDYTRPHGEVTYADAHRNERGVATICLGSQSDLKNVIRKMDGAELNGKKISVTDVSEASRSRSRSRSRSPHSHRRNSRRSKSASKSISRSRSRSKSKSKSPHSRSKSASRSASRSPNKSVSRSRSRSRSRSHSKS